MKHPNHKFSWDFLTTVRASLAIYHLISNARPWKKIVKYSCTDIPRNQRYFFIYSIKSFHFKGKLDRYYLGAHQWYPISVVLDSCRDSGLVLVSYWSIRFSHVITKLIIHHLYSLITTHDDFDSADPSSIKDACHIWTQLNSPCLP